MRFPDRGEAPFTRAGDDFIAADPPGHAGSRLRHRAGRGRGLAEEQQRVEQSAEGARIEAGP